MSRIHAVSPETATEAQSEVLAAAKKKFGGVPNIISTMAQSPSVANAYLSMSGALAGGTLPAALREQIALAVGQQSSRDYCVAAHTVIGKGAGLSEDETVAARLGQGGDAKSQAALTFVKKLVAERGWVSDGDVDALREAGFTDGEVGELVANTALNLFTNYFNHVAQTDVDFPDPPALNT